MIGPMRRLLPVLLVLVLVACQQQSAGWLDQHGNSLTLAELQGRYQLVNYWAEWCAPCREELPELNALASAYSELAVIGIHFDRAEGADLLALSERMGIAFPVLGHDFAQAYDLALPQVLPTTYVLGPEGELRETLQGPQDKAALLQALREQGAALD